MTEFPIQIGTPAELDAAIADAAFGRVSLLIGDDGGMTTLELQRAKFSDPLSFSKISSSLRRCINSRCGESSEYVESFSGGTGWCF